MPTNTVWLKAGNWMTATFESSAWRKNRHRKMPPSSLAVIGRYILTSDIFEILRSTPPGKNGEVKLTDALQNQAANGKVIAYRFQGRRFDCGGIEGFVTAANFYFNRRKTVATHNGDTTKK